MYRNFLSWIPKTLFIVSSSRQPMCGGVGIWISEYIHWISHSRQLHRHWRPCRWWCYHLVWARGINRIFSSSPLEFLLLSHEVFVFKQIMNTHSVGSYGNSSSATTTMKIHYRITRERKTFLWGITWCHGIASFVKMSRDGKILWRILMLED